MSGIILVVACAVTAAIFFYFASTLDEKHFFLKLLTVFFGIFGLMFVAKTAVDNNSNCDIVVRNQTIVGNFTSFEYTRYCETDLHTTDSKLFWLVGGYFSIFVIYCFIYFSKDIFDALVGAFGKKL